MYLSFGCKMHLPISYSCSVTRLAGKFDLSIRKNRARSEMTSPYLG